MALDLSSLKSAVESLEQAILVIQDKKQFNLLTKQQQKVIKAGVIQNFEFTYELCWKFIKRWLEANYSSSVDGLVRNELFRIAAEHQLITDVTKWFDYHNARNKTSHIYDEDVAEEVFKISCNFLPDAKKLLKRLEEHND